MEVLSDCKFDVICRVCLKEKENLIFIFSPEFSDISDKISICADVEVYENDGLPANICKDCLSNLSNSFNFRILCAESDKTLRGILNQEIKKEEADSPHPLSQVVVVIKEEPSNDYSDNIYDSNLEETEDVKMLSSDVAGKQCPWCGCICTTTSELITHTELCRISATNLETTERKQQKTDTLQGIKKRTYTRRKPLRVHRCEPCNKIFGSRKCWVRHNTIKHGIAAPPKPQPECKVCKASFNCWNELLDHERIERHYGKELCHYCNKSFSRSYISLHLREHTSEEPFLCNACGRTYNNQGTFLIHVKCCSNAEKTLQCPRCDKRFHTKSRLSQHQRVHSNEKPYVCETCGTGFRRRSNLRNHVMVHSDSRPHKCSVCQKLFRTRTVLNEHMRVHTGVRPYRCEECDAAFTQKHCLKTHQMKHRKLKVEDMEDEVPLSKMKSGTS